MGINDPAPIIIAHLEHVIPTLVDGDPLFADVQWSVLGDNSKLDDPYAIITYESSEQNEFSSIWETVVLIQFYQHRPSVADYEDTPSIDLALLKDQSQKWGASLLAYIAEWFGDGPKCCQGYWMTRMGRASNSPQTGPITEDGGFLHETRWTVVSQYHPDPEAS